MAYFRNTYTQPINGLGAYFKNTYTQPINGLGACPCAGVGDAAADAAAAVNTSDPNRPSAARLLIGFGAAFAVVLAADILIRKL